MRPPFILVSSSYLNAFRRAAECRGPSYRLNPIIGEQNIYLSACQDFNGLHLHCYLSFSGQVARLEAKSAATETAEEARRKYASVLIRANEMVESIKQAIVLLQIAKNAAAPDEPGAIKEFNGAIDALTKSGREGRSTMEHPCISLHILCRIFLLTLRSAHSIMIQINNLREPRHKTLVLGEVAMSVQSDLTSFRVMWSLLLGRPLSAGK